MTKKKAHFYTSMIALLLLLIMTLIMLIAFKSPAGEIGTLTL